MTFFSLYKDTKHITWLSCVNLITSSRGNNKNISAIIVWSGARNEAELGQGIATGIINSIALLGLLNSAIHHCKFSGFYEGIVDCGARRNTNK